MPEPTDGMEEQKGLDFEALLARFKQKMAAIPEEYREAIGWLYVYRQVQDQRKRLQNRANQMSEGKRVFWGSVLPTETLGAMSFAITDAASKIQEGEEAAAKMLHRLMRKSSWYLEVAVPAARGIGMSSNAGTLTAAKILDAYGSPSRFQTFGQLIRYSRLAPENGQAPKRKHGQRIHYNPAAFQALFDLTDSWNRLPECIWRQKWDAWKLWYQQKYPEYPKGRIHNMARRKIMREFLHDLWDLWVAWEQGRRADDSTGILAVTR